jgi:hypothetical protein
MTTARATNPPPGSGNPTQDWDANLTSARNHLRRSPHTRAWSDEEIDRAAAEAVRRRRDRAGR